MKGNFKYINKKMLAGILVGAITFSVAGCGCEAKPNYVETSKGVYELSNSIDFSELKDYQLVEMKVDNKVDLYVTYQKQKNVGGVYYSPDYITMYYNVLNNEIIYTIYDVNQEDDVNQEENSIKNENTLLKEENMFDYLIAYNEIQDSYTKEDIERILGKVKKDWNFTDQKENSKEKSKIKE